MNVKIFAFAAACVICGCTPSGTSSAPEQTPALEGRWEITDVVLNDSVRAMPAEIPPGTKQYIVFSPDSTYSVRTNCNSIGGSYTLNGDSLTIGDGFCTEMACDNMVVEDLIKQILPEVRSAVAGNDSTMRLTTAGESYISLRKAE